MYLKNQISNGQNIPLIFNIFNIPLIFANISKHVSKFLMKINIDEQNNLNDKLILKFK